MRQGIKNKQPLSSLKLLTVLVTALFLLSSAAVLAAPDLSNFSLVFSDEFDQQSLDASRWQTANRWGPYVIAEDEDQLYVDELGINAASMQANGGNTPSPFTFTSDTLQLNASRVENSSQIPERPDSASAIWLNFPTYRTYDVAAGVPFFEPSSVKFLSGLLSSENAFSFAHGYVEARVKLPAGGGLLPAISLRSRYLVERAPMLSLFEYANADSDVLSQGYNYYEPQDDYAEVVVPPFLASGIDFSSNWHTLGMAWDPKEIVWYIDGEIIGRIDTASHPVPNQAMHIVINLALGGSEDLTDGTTAFPATFDIDYIRVYQRDIPATLTQSVLDTQYHLMFEDDFSGSSLDITRWNTHTLWGPYWQINAEQQFYPDVAGVHNGLNFATPPVSLENGNLILQAAPVAATDLPSLPTAASDEFLQHPDWRYSRAFNNPQFTNPAPGEAGHDSGAPLNAFLPTYTSGIVTTNESFSFTHGYAEIRAKLPSSTGLWPAFWLHNSYFVGREPEIAVAEITNGSRLDHAYHFRNDDGTLAVNTWSTQGSFADTFHTYGVSWEPGKLSWYVDGQLRHTHTSEDVPVQSMYAVLNLAVGGDANGSVDGAQLPASFEIDYVRIYQSKSTPPEAVQPPVPEPGNVVESDTQLSLSQPDRDTFTRIEFAENFQSPPIVIPSLLSSNDSAPAEIVLSSISATGVDIRIGEWEYLDGAHGDENVSLFTLPPGSHNLGGLTALAGRAPVTGGYTRVEFTESFATTPVVLAHLLSDRDDIVATVRLRNIDEAGFSVRLQTEEALGTSGDTRELFYVAIEEGFGNYQGRILQTGRTNRSVTHMPYVIKFDDTFENPLFYAQDQQTYGGDTSLVRLLSLTPTEAEVFIEEEQSKNSETRHTRESVGWMVTGVGDIELPLPDNPPVAAFTSGLTAGAINALAVTFSSTSSDDQDIAAYSWDLGDGVTANSASVDHVYAGNGIYDVTLTVTDTAGQTSTTTNPVTINDSAPTASVVASVTSGLVPLTVDLISTSSDAQGIASYSWDLGNGDSLVTTETVSVTYTTPGEYTVTLSVEDTAGQISSVEQVISVEPSPDSPPIADFDASLTAGASNALAVTFTSTSSDDTGITSYSWDLGDGNTINTATVNHVYAGNGTYDVILTVTDTAGQISTAADQVVVNDPAPTAVIEASVTSGDAPLTVELGSASSDAQGIASYSWNLGNGSAVVTTQNTSVTYATAGSYTITLTVEDTAGQSSIAQQVVTVTAALPEPASGVNVVSHDTIVVSQADETVWTRVNFLDSWAQTPVVIPSLLTSNDDEPAEIMLSELSETGIDVQTGEWEYLDGAHADETISLFMLEPGQHDLGGLTALAGKATATGSNRRIEFDTRFDTPPIVLAHLVSDKSDLVATIRLRNIDETGFRVRLQTEEALGTAGESREFHYIAIEAGTGSHAGRTLIAGKTDRQVTHNRYTLEFGQSLNDPLIYGQDQQTFGGDTSLVRLVNLSSSQAEIFIEEEQSQNDEIRHTSEIVGWVVVGF